MSANLLWDSGGVHTLTDDLESFLFLSGRCCVTLLPLNATLTVTHVVLTCPNLMSMNSVGIERLIHWARAPETTPLLQPLWQLGKPFVSICWAASDNQGSLEDGLECLKKCKHAGLPRSLLPVHIPSVILRGSHSVFCLLL